MQLSELRQVNQQELTFGNDYQLNRGKNNNKTTRPYVLVDGPEPTQDLSYKWVQKFENVREIEQGVPLAEFEENQ